MMNTATTTTRLMAMAATKTRAGRRVSTSPRRASRAGGPTGSVPATGRTREAAAAMPGRGDAGRGDPGRDPGRGDSGQGYDSDQGYEDGPGDDHNGYGPGGGYGYGADEYATGAYDLPEGSDAEPAERSGRRRKDKDRGERTGILRLRRDRGEDIWPDDGISDEDYWASVASDRPLTGANPPLESAPLAAADSRPMGRPGGQASGDGGARMPATDGDDVRAGAGPRLGADSRTGVDQRFADEQRGVTGRLGPPPGLRGDYQPGGAPISARPGTGPQAARPETGPLAARPGTGPQAVRSGAAGSAGAWSSQAGFTQSGAGQASYRPSGPQASYQQGAQAGRPQDGRETDSRQADRGADWGERTERIDRVNASGYPEPRGNSRGQGPGRPGPSRTSEPLGAPVAVGRGGVGASGDGGWGSADGADRRAADHRAADHRAASRDADRDNVRNSGGWPISARGGLPADRAGDDDPLTSRAYSRAAVSDADGRSYRVAARRSQAQAKLTEQATATFTAAAGYPSEESPRRAVPDRGHRGLPGRAVPDRRVPRRPAPDRRDQRESGRAVPDRRVRPVPAGHAGAGRALPGLRRAAGAVRPVEFTRRPGPVVPADPAWPLRACRPKRASKRRRTSRSRQAGRSERPARPPRVRPVKRIRRTKRGGRVRLAKRSPASRQLWPGQPAYRVHPALRAVPDAGGAVRAAAQAAAAAPALPAISPRRPDAIPGGGQRESRRQRELRGQRADRRQLPPG